MRKYYIAILAVLISTFAAALHAPTASAAGPFDSTPDYRAALNHDSSEAQAPVLTSTTLTASATVSGTPGFGPTLDAFVAAVKNGKSDKVTGVYASNTLALRIVQQPAENPAYVSSILGTATQFSLASQYGTVGLLAHNYRSGASFFNLTVGQEVDVVYGDGSVRRYVISEIRRFQALSPNDPYSTFVDLDSGSGQISSRDLFNQIYAVGNRLVFQTCINANGDLSWGRLFVTAMPLQ